MYNRSRCHIDISKHIRQRILLINEPEPDNVASDSVYEPFSKKGLPVTFLALKCQKLTVQAFGCSFASDEQ